MKNLVTSKEVSKCKNCKAQTRKYGSDYSCSDCPPKKERTLTAEDAAAEIYSIGFKNGSIEMKNKILKKVNRDWSLLKIKNPASLVIKILETINKIK